jgi:hypothetical protein
VNCSLALAAYSEWSEDHLESIRPFHIDGRQPIELPAQGGITPRQLPNSWHDRSSRLQSLMRNI